MMISEWRLPQPDPDVGAERRSPAEAADRLPRVEPSRARRPPGAALVRLVERLVSRRHDNRWVGDSMERTTEELAVYVFRGEATVAHDLVVSHRGPGRDRLLGGQPTGAALIDWAFAVHPADRAVHRAAESYAQLSKGEPLSASFRIIGVDGVTRWMTEHLAPRWEHGRLLVDGIVIDVTTQRLARTEAEQAQRRLEAVMRSAHTYVWVSEVEADGTLTSIYSVAGVEAILGRGPDAAGDPAPRWRTVVHPDDRELFDAVIVAAGHGQSFDIEYRLIGLDGVTRIVRDQAVATLLGEGRYRLDGLVQEVTAEHDARNALSAALDTARAAHAELERLGRLDSLTGLTNRRHATKLMDEALARRDPVGIAMLDIDGFKQVNDTYGHAGGDAVLTEIARRLAATRAEDLVARWGGEEFCVLLTDIGDDASLLAAAERLRSAVADEAVLLDDGRSVRITTSIGVGRPGGPTERLERLVIAADEALYDAKRGGRNQVSLAAERPPAVVAGSVS
jgi:diguanylate cyclase (GGDEF)-like protein